MKKSKLELYLHIPFCVRKCEYCDFLSFSAGEEAIDRYVNRLKEEILQYKDKMQAYRVSSVFWGGGTPSLLSGEQMKELMQTVHKVFDISSHGEITMETNPGTLTKEKLSEYRQAGINRLSMGLQSADDRELKLLGRIHTYEEFLKNFYEARNAGFHNINIDIMSALPGQTAASYRETLKKVISLEPEHISAYSLIIEEGTPFYEQYRADDEKRVRGEKPNILPDEEEEREMYRMTGEFLRRAGYHRYEISNYARPGKECRHNCGYWQGTEYLGLGLGSSSYINGKRMKNESEIKSYLEGAFCREEELPLSHKDFMEEFMFLGLRLCKGVSEAEFERRFGDTIDRIYGEKLEKLKKQHLMERTGNRWRLTAQGIDISNYILSEFLLD